MRAKTVLLITIVVGIFIGGIPIAVAADLIIPAPIAVPLQIPKLVRTDTLAPRKT